MCFSPRTLCHVANVAEGIQISCLECWIPPFFTEKHTLYLYLRDNSRAKVALLVYLELKLGKGFGGFWGEFDGEIKKVHNWKHLTSTNMDFFYA